MPPNVHGPIPLEALRDLLGIVRALYAAWCAAGANPIELDELAAVGKELATALDLARRTQPGTVGHRAAWSRAEKATEQLGLLVTSVEMLRPTLNAAVGRVVSGGGPKPTSPGLAEREARKRHSRTRS